MQNIWKQKCECSSGEWAIHTSINRKYNLENCVFQGQILKFLLYFYSLFIWLCSDFITIHLNTGNHRSDQAFEICEPRQELLYTDLFPCSMNIKLHSPLHFPWLWDTAVDCFMSKISLPLFTDSARNGSAFHTPLPGDLHSFWFSSALWKLLTFGSCVGCGWWTEKPSFSLPYTHLCRACKFSLW